MKIVRFKEDDLVDGAPPMMPEDWRALWRAGWIIDWTIQTTPDERRWILRGEMSAAQAAYLPVTSVELGAESWRRTLPRDIPPLSLEPLPLHLAKECPDVVPFKRAVEVPALAELREMRPGILARRAQIVAVTAFEWTVDVARELGDPNWNVTVQDIARAVRRVVWEHMSAGQKAGSAEVEEG